MPYKATVEKRTPKNSTVPRFTLTWYGPSLPLLISFHHPGCRFLQERKEGPFTPPANMSPLLHLFSVWAIVEKKNTTKQFTIEFPLLEAKETTAQDI